VIARLTPAEPRSPLTVGELNAFLRNLPSLAMNADGFAQDVRAIRAEFPAEANPWDWMVDTNVFIRFEKSGWPVLPDCMRVTMARMIIVSRIRKQILGRIKENGPHRICAPVPAFNLDWTPLSQYVK